MNGSPTSNTSLRFLQSKLKKTTQGSSTPFSLTKKDSAPPLTSRKPESTTAQTPLLHTPQMQKFYSADAEPKSHEPSKLEESRFGEPRINDLSRSAGESQLNLTRDPLPKPSKHYFSSNAETGGDSSLELAGKTFRSEYYTNPMASATHRETFFSTSYYLPRNEHSMTFFSEEKPDYVKKLHEELSRNFSKVAKYEGKKVKLSRELYYTQDQVEMKKKMLQELKNEFRQSTGGGHARRIVNKRREHIEIAAKGRLHLQIESGDREFPMTVKLDVSEGEFTILVSRQMVPDEENYDYKFLKDHFMVNYNKSTEYNKVYFTILAGTNLRMVMMVMFATSNKKEEHEGAGKVSAALENQKLKQRIYVDPFPDFDPRVQKYPNEIEEIMQKRKQQMLELSGGRSIVKDNIKIATAQHIHRARRLISSATERDRRIEKAQKKKEALFEEFKKKKAAEKIERDLRRAYAEMKKRNEGKRKNLKVHNENWILLLNVHYILKQMIDLKNVTALLSKCGF